MYCEEDRTDQIFKRIKTSFHDHEVCDNVIYQQISRPRIRRCTTSLINFGFNK